MTLMREKIGGTSVRAGRDLARPITSSRRFRVLVRQVSAVFYII